MLEQNEHIHSQSDQDFNPEVLERAVLSEDEKDALQTRNLLNEIQEALEAYKGSINSLSHKSGVDPKTIRKMRNGEYKRAPNAETVQRVLSVVSKQRTVRDLASFYGNSIELFLKKAFPVFFIEDAKYVSEVKIQEELLSKIKDIYSYQVLKIVKGSKPITKNELTNILTKFILKHETHLFDEDFEDEDVSKFKPIASYKVDKMIKNGLIIEERETGLIKLFFQNIHIQMPYELCRKYEGSSYNFFQQEHADLLDYFWQVSFGTCSHKELNDISHIMYDAYLKSLEILTNSKSTEIKINLNSSLTPLRYHTRGQAREEALERRRQKGEIL